MNLMLCALCEGELVIIGSAEEGYVKVTKCLDCDAQLLRTKSKKEKISLVTYVARKKLD